MKSKLYYSLITVVALLLFAACDHGHKHNEEDSHSHGDKGANTDPHANEGHSEEVHLNTTKFNAIKMEMGPLTKRNITDYIETNGELRVAPQDEASITAIIGANVQQITVIEGDAVKKGQVLAWLSHPSLLQLQTDYVTSWNRLQYLKEEYSRQEQLYQENVASGKTFQKTKAEFNTVKAQVSATRFTLKQLGLNPQQLEQNKLYHRIPVKSPLTGYVRHVYIKLSQFVQPQTVMFDVVNIDHIHADLMVFEKDMYKVKVGQKVRLHMESHPDKGAIAEIFNVGKTFEENPKALHLHAEIENKEGLLLPGMFVRGKILLEKADNYALPSNAVVREGDKTYIWSVSKEVENGEEEWHFSPIEVKTGEENERWVEIFPLDIWPKDKMVAYNNAYTLMAELKKGEAGHDH